MVFELHLETFCLALLTKPPPPNSFNTLHQTIAPPFRTTEGTEPCRHIDFRVALAVFLSERLAGAPVRPEELMAVAGASHGIDLCARLLARPGDVALVEVWLCVWWFCVFLAARSA